MTAPATVPQMPPCEQDQDDDELECWTCKDKGEYVPDGSDLLMPCPDCERGEWNNVTELWDDARRGK